MGIQHADTISPGLQERHQQRLRRIAQVLARNAKYVKARVPEMPWRDASTRDPRRLGEIEKDKVRAALKALEADAKAKKVIEQKAAGRLGFWDKASLRLGRPTPAAAAWKIAHEQARSSEGALQTARDALDGELRTAQEHGARLANERSRAYREWQESPAVKQARETIEMNKRVLKMAEDGHPQVLTALAQGNVRGAQYLAQRAIEDEAMRRAAMGHNQAHGWPAPRSR